MHQPKYCLFYDNHTMPACPDVGSTFDVEEFTNRIQRCGVDYVTFHARCNMGMAYYDTKIGIKHPSLEYDLFGKLAESCQRKQIALTAYINGGISNEEGLRHRDWTTLNFDGREYCEDRLSPAVRTMCYNSPYQDNLIGMVREVAENYPVAGFFIDCLAPFPCICPYCIGEMKRLGIDWRVEEAVIDFARRSVLRLCNDIALTARAINPEYLLYFNGPSFEDQLDCGSYLECECLPTVPQWGYEYLPIMSHYMRTLGERPILNMTARFYEWGDFGGLRPQAGLEYDLLYGLANGMRPNIGGHFHPRGDINHAVFDRIESIYKKLQEYEPWFAEAKNVSEIAVVYPKDIDSIQTDGSLRGVTRMLSELKQQFDIVTEQANWEDYQVLILPDEIELSEEIARRVKAHIDAGKGVISSGHSGVDEAKTRFVLEQYWGVKYIGKSDIEPPYFSPEPGFDAKLPEMPIGLYVAGTEIEPLAETIVGAKLVMPYYSKHWDGEHAHCYNPPNKTSELPLLTVKGKVTHFSHPIFKAYYQTASVEIRQLFANVLDQCHPQPVVKTENLPSFARVFLTRQANRTIVHILAYVPEHRGCGIGMIEEPITVQDVTISVRQDGVDIDKLYSAPSGAALDYKVDNGYISVEIPVMKGYAMIVMEEK